MDRNFHLAAIGLASHFKDTHRFEHLQKLAGCKQGPMSRFAVDVGKKYFSFGLEPVPDVVASVVDVVSSVVEVVVSSVVDVVVVVVDVVVVVVDVVPLDEPSSLSSLPSSPQPEAASIDKTAV